MKYILLIFFFLVVSCRERESSNDLKNTVIAHNETEYYIYKDENRTIIVKDTMCPFEEKRALLDVEKGIMKIYFSYLVRKRGLDIDYAIESSKHLSKFNILVDTTFDEYSMGSVHTGLFKIYCYQDKMLAEIEKKYGTTFLDSICDLVEKEYVLKNPDKIYETTECDGASLYPGAKDFNDMLDKSKRDFFNQFKYPEDYVYKNEKYFSYTIASFIISKTGKISNLKVKSTFQNPKNEKYTDYFENEVMKFINDVKFLPATSCGIPVKSKLELVFFHK